MKSNKIGTFKFIYTALKEYCEEDIFLCLFTLPLQ